MSNFLEDTCSVMYEAGGRAKALGQKNVWKERGAQELKLLGQGAVSKSEMYRP